MNRSSLATRLADVGRDARVAARSLSRDRTFTATALLTLVVCLAANAAIFSIVRSVVLKPLPFPEPERIVLMSNIYPKAGYSVTGPGTFTAGVPDYFDRLREMTVYESQALYVRINPTLGLQDGAQRVPAIAVTPSFFPLLRARTRLGRTFLPEEGEVGATAPVILSYGFWQRQFGGDASIIGKDVRVDGTPRRVVGVLAQDFRYVWNIDLWVPLTFSAEVKSDAYRHSNNWTNIARLKAGATVEQAQQQLDALNARNSQRFPQFATILRDAGFRTVVTRLADDVTRDVRPTLYLLWGGVLLVLLVGGVNLANLTLVRSAGRAREMATRHALGAEVTRLARQLLTETTVLTLTGGVLGTLGGWWMLRSVGALHLELLPRGDEIGLDWQTVAVMIVLAIAVGILAGFVPISQLPRTNLGEALREGGRGGTAGSATGRLRRALATSQVALAFVLLIGAGLLLASFRAVLRIDPGFQSSGVVTATVSLPGFRYTDDNGLIDVTGRILDRVRSLPGVASAGFTSSIPLGGDYSSGVIFAEGYQAKKGESFVSPNYVTVTEGYFQSMRMRLARGRFFDQRDTPSSPPVVIVDERLAQHFWPNQDPIGRRMYRPTSANDLDKITPNTKFLTVIGVVRDVRLTGLTPQDAPVGVYYYPYTQAAERLLVLTVRADRDVESLAGAVRNSITDVDREIPVFSVQTMNDRMDSALVPRRVPMLIGLVFGIVALFLAAVGIYGVLAYQVSQRRREIGIRMALGSSTRRILGLVVRDGMQITGIGLAVGLVGLVGLTRVIRGMLYGVQPADPMVIALVAVVLAGVALAATLIPARRAARVSPMSALND
jgi:putative ABC transport system permease protein